MSRIKGHFSKSPEFESITVIKPNFRAQVTEKNWMPIIHHDEVLWVYSCEPYRIISASGDLFLSRSPPTGAYWFHGGSQCIAFDGGYIGLIHETFYPPGRTRVYLHRFIWLNHKLEFVLWTQPFYFVEIGVEFACGLALHPGQESFYITFGTNDEQSWLSMIDVKTV